MEQTDMTTFDVTQAGIDNHGLPVAGAIQELLDSGKRYLSFPAGSYTFEKTLRIPSGTRISAHAEARFRLGDSAATTCDDYLLTNADHEGGNRDIEISGGIWDGNQKGNRRPEGLMDQGYTGAMLHFYNVENLKLAGLCLTNSEAYYARFTHVHHFHIENIIFDSDLIRPNNDGIHLGGNCSNGVIRNLSATTPNVPGDDLVALNADDALGRTEVRGMTSGPIENIEIENLSATSCHTFVRLLSVVSPIRNVTIRGVHGGCNVAALNGDGARGCRVKVFDEENPPFDDGVGLLENVKVSNLRVHKTKNTRNALIDIQERMRNFVVEDFVRDQEADCAPDTPTIRFAHVKEIQRTINGETVSLEPAEGSFVKSEEFLAQFELLRVDTSVQGS